MPLPGLPAPAIDDRDKVLDDFVEPNDVPANVLRIFKRLNLQQQVGQLLMVSVRAVQMTPLVDSFLRDLLPGGLVLGPHNVAPGWSVPNFIRDMQEAVANHTPAMMFVSVDQEGGRALRDPLSEKHRVTQFPSQMAFGVVGSEQATFRAGRALGGQLRRVGVNMNLAPVLDVNSNPANPVINLRAFGSTADVVGRLGSAYARGLQAGGCLAVGKHFPGHGDTARDSHLELPRVNRSLRELQRVDLAPFQAAFRAGMAGLMSAHITYPAVLADDQPATLSHRFLTGILRHDMGFRGLVMTDDLRVDAMRLPAGEAAVRSVLAGADVVLSTATPALAQQMRDGLLHAVQTGRISHLRLRASVLRILAAKDRFGVLAADSPASVQGPPDEASPLPALPTPTVWVEDPDTTSAIASASELNANVSQSAIIYSGDPDLLAPPSSTIRVFIVYHDHLRRLIAADVRDANDVVLRDLTGLQGPGDPAWARAGTILYAYFLLLEAQPLTLLHNMALRRGMHLVALCSGNPFQFHAGTNDLFDAALLSLGNTPASLVALALALRGRLAPRTPNVTGVHLTLPGQP
eukprot:EG_transcript_4527